MYLSKINAKAISIQHNTFDAIIYTVGGMTVVIRDHQEVRKEYTNSYRYVNDTFYYSESNTKSFSFISILELLLL